ncbi:DUF5610 domain-containing protein [Pseudoalteromonas fenneropenaei]|uniref:DUF5610 domain-containing protein n=1 Tax=Pseudoalteromonas fenneropenaei TaxID=1737459 RepID=A0ABV7CQD2_9GAMM
MMKVGQQTGIFQPNLDKFPLTRKPGLKAHTALGDSYVGDKFKASAKMLQDKLNEALGIEKKTDKAEKDKPLFDFEAVVKNVLDFVKGAVNMAKVNGKSDDELQEMLGKARKGVEAGVGEASKLLEDSGLLDDDIKDGIAKSHEGINKGLDDFEQELFGPKQPQGVMFGAAQYASLQNQAEFAFTTAEGDEIVISFNDAYQAEQGFAAQKSGNNTSFAATAKQSHEVQFSISVNGELNDAEQEAINGMMKDIRDISNAFFRGDFDKAFDEAKKLSLDNEQIAQFSMDLKQTKRSAAISQYQETNPAQQAAKAVQPLNEGLKDIYGQGKALGIEKQLPDIMEWMNQGQARLKEFLDYAQAYFNTLSKKES